MADVGFHSGSESDRDPPFAAPLSPVSSHDSPPKKKRRNLKPRDPNALREALEVPRDGTGRPVMPIQLSSTMLVHSLGTISSTKGYHQLRYIFPIGYKSSRLYVSFRNIGERIWYTSEICRGTKGPVFRVTAEDAPSDVIESNTSTGAWTEVLRRVDELRSVGKRKFTAISGPEQFGYVNPTVARLMEELDGVSQCTGYKKQNFVVVGDLGDKKIRRRRSFDEEEEIAAGTVGDPYATASSSEDEKYVPKDRFADSGDEWIVDV